MCTVLVTISWTGPLSLTKFHLKDKQFTEISGSKSFTRWLVHSFAPCSAIYMDLHCIYGSAPSIWILCHIYRSVLYIQILHHIYGSNTGAIYTPPEPYICRQSHIYPFAPSPPCPLSLPGPLGLPWDLRKPWEPSETFGSLLKPLAALGLQSDSGALIPLPPHPLSPPGASENLRSLPRRGLLEVLGPQSDSGALLPLLPLTTPCPYVGAQDKGSKGE